MTLPAETHPACRAARGWTSASIDGEATVAEEAALRTHLDECPDCRAWKACVESLALQVRTSEPVPPPVLSPPLPLAAVAATETRAPAPARRPARWRALAFSAVAVAATVAAVLLSTPGGGEQSRQRPLEPSTTLAYNTIVPNIPPRKAQKMLPVDG